jgi:hypothetical protein
MQTQTDKYGFPGNIGDHKALACRIYRSTNQSILNATNTLISFDSIRGPTVNRMWSAADPEIIYIREAGWYIYALAVAFAINATGRRLISFNSLTEPSGDFAFYEIPVTYNTAANLELSLSGVMWFPKGAKLRAIVFQNSGGALNLVALPQHAPELSMCFLGR